MSTERTASQEGRSTQTQQSTQPTTQSTQPAQQTPQSAQPQSQPTQTPAPRPTRPMSYEEAVARQRELAAARESEHKEEK